MIWDLPGQSPTPAHCSLTYIDDGRGKRSLLSFKGWGDECEHEITQKWAGYMGRKERRVLIVDDDPSVRRIFRVLLSGLYTIREAGSGEEAIAGIYCWMPDLILLDIGMPEMDGYEACLRIKEAETALPPLVIMVSAKSATDELVKAFEVGADDYLIKPVCPEELQSRVDLHFRLRESQVQTLQLQKEVEQHHRELRQISEDRMKQVVAVQDVAVFTLAKLAESRDCETGEHLLRLRAYAQCLARQLRENSVYSNLMDSTFLDDLYRSSPLHDIGKVGIPDSILLKPGTFTADEFETMKRHTVIGGNILHEAVMQLKGGSFLAMAAQIAQFHHERWDGSGYMAGLVGEEIPLPARIVSVVDVFDALTTKRPYKPAWPIEKAKRMIDEGTGKQFDPVIVQAFDCCFDEISQIRQRHCDKTPVAIGANSLLEFSAAEHAIF